MKLDNNIFIDTIINLLSQGHQVEINAEGYSMYPLLQPGDKLTVTPAKWESLRKGDIIVWRDNDRLIAHRIIKKQADYCIPAGDARITNDGQIIPTQVLGRITAYRRNDVTKSISSFKSKFYASMIVLLNPITRQVFTKLANWRRR